MSKKFVFILFSLVTIFFLEISPHPAFSQGTCRVNGTTLVDTNNDGTGDTGVATQVNVRDEMNTFNQSIATRDIDGWFSMLNVPCGKLYLVSASVPFGFEIAPGKPITQSVFLDSDKWIHFVFIPKPTPTPTPTTTPTPTPTKTPTPTPSRTPTPTPTLTPTPTTPAATFTPTPTPTAEIIPEDINRDGCVGILDFNIWLTAYQTGKIVTGTYPDVNLDGAVDLLDFNRWYRAMTNLPAQKLCH